MDYEKLVCDMLEHADNADDQQAFANLMRALAFGIAQSSSNAPTIDIQNKILASAFAAIVKEAHSTFMEINGLSPDELMHRVSTVGPVQ